MKLNPEVEQFRCVHPLLGKSKQGALMGWFEIPKSHPMGPLYLMVCEAINFDWDHVSVSIPEAKGKFHTPTWSQMNWVKSMFWDEEETVLQFHPKKSQYKNFHPGCLHLWKKAGVDHELPPGIMVAP